MLANDMVTGNGGKTVTAYNRILADIVLGRRLPGAVIDREALARDLGISVQPITTAIDQLAADGFVDIRLQKGSFVAPIRLSRMIEATFVMSALIRAAFRFARQERDPEMRAAQEQALEIMTAAAERGDLLGVIAAVRTYRDLVLVATHSALARDEGTRAGAYLHWAIDRVLTARPPVSPPSDLAVQLCRGIRDEYHGLHEALLAGDAVKFADHIGVLYDNSRRTFRRVAEQYPDVILIAE